MSGREFACGNANLHREKNRTLFDCKCREKKTLVKKDSQREKISKWKIHKVAESRLRSSSQTVASSKGMSVDLIFPSMAALQVSAPSIMEWDSRNRKSIHGLQGSPNQISNINLDFLPPIGESPRPSALAVLSRNPFLIFSLRIPGSLYHHLGAGCRWYCRLFLWGKIITTQFSSIFFSFSCSPSL